MLISTGLKIAVAVVSAGVVLATGMVMYTGSDVPGSSGTTPELLSQRDETNMIIEDGRVYQAIELDMGTSTDPIADYYDDITYPDTDILDATSTIPVQAPSSPFELLSEPIRPMSPTKFSMPSIPSIPPIPGLPPLPSIPSMPSIPGMPSMPGIPSIPSFPGIPSIPGMPSIPGIPSIPSFPSMPSIPSLSSFGGVNGSAAKSYNIDPCYMMGSSPKGSNLYIATTCNSGWQSNGSKPPIFHKDCGDPKKSLCDLAATTAGGGGPAYACLWQVCKLKGGGNAIWDKNTKKCGCDNPGSNLGGFKDGIATAGLNSVPTTPAQNPSQVSGSSETRNDAVNREALTKAGITINKQENGPDGSTSLNGLTEQSTNKLISIRGASGDSGMTITGGSEAGHSTHTDASGNSTQTVDLRYTAGSNLNKYIETGIKSGSSYYFSQSDGSWVRFYNEPGSTNSFGTQPRHWHVELDTKRRP